MNLSKKEQKTQKSNYNRQKILNNNLTNQNNFSMNLNKRELKTLKNKLKIFVKKTRNLLNKDNYLMS